MNNNAFNNRDDNTSNNIDNQNNGNVHINGNGNQVFNQVQQNFDYQKRKTSIKDIIQTTLQANKFDENCVLNASKMLSFPQE